MIKKVFKILILIVILVLIVFLIVTPIFTNSNIEKKIDRLKSEEFVSDTKIDFLSSEFKSLPVFVRKYLERSISVENKPQQLAHIKMQGITKEDPSSSWKETEVDLYHSLTEPSFVWIASTTEFKFLWTKTVNSLINLVGESSSKFLSSITIDENEGAKLNENYFKLYLFNSIFSPTVLMPNQNVHWTALTPTSAEVVVWYKNITGKAIFYFNKAGDVEKIVSENMFLPNTLESKKGPFTVYLADYREVNGIRIPAYFEYQWNFWDGDLTVCRLNIISADYN